MAPLPENNTDRVWVSYDDGINQHDLLVRHTGGPTNVGNVLSSISEFFTQLGPQLYAITIVAARYSVEGSPISLPVAWEGPGGFGSGAMPASVAPRQLCYLARSNNGRFAKWFIWGCKLETPGGYRFSLGDNTDLADAWNVISAAQAADNIWCAIDGTNPTLYSYIDVNFNSYYEAKARS